MNEMRASIAAREGLGGPFDLNDEMSYQAWRKAKLQDYPSSAGALVCELAGGMISPAEQAALTASCRKSNMALYHIKAAHPEGRQWVGALGRAMGLERLDCNLRADEDSISALQVKDQGTGNAYIPYTNRALSWHTDGYYNRPEQRIRGIVMHCETPAAEGGENLLLDHEIAYLLMRDENPAWVRALMASDAMTIPANVENGVELRGAQSGPVFSLDPQSGALHMRYTARTRSIEWKDDVDTLAAVEFLRSLLNEGSPYVFRYRLQAGEGIICNNVLHARQAFRDSDAGKRLLFRARYYDRVAGTGPDQVDA